ncbi:hypothetical protein [Marinilabilia rubra]|uniref:Delta-60 repeat domain-containing protein n=1 Tax=Marinilabilia rubra TaxID=2162893 RepID=A0A2U2B6Y0_9BACT|nr:hypothetical protein [Marinilabilia rubra]PWD98802.1 hypothetical protein DDZ16_13770 [Marinilabilia rubra]
MPIEVIDGFKVSKNVPVDTQRTVVATLEDRDAIDLAVRYEGMETRVLTTKTKYVLEGGITNNHWKPVLEDELNALVSPLEVRLPDSQDRLLALDQDIELSIPENNMGIKDLSLINVFGQEKPVLSNFAFAAGSILMVPEGLHKISGTIVGAAGTALFSRKNLGRRYLNKGSKGFNLTSSFNPSVAAIEADYTDDPDHPRIWLLCSAVDYLGTKITDRLLLLDHDGALIRSDFGGYFTGYMKKVEMTPDHSGLIVLGNIDNAEFKHICKIDRQGNLDPGFLKCTVGFAGSSGASIFPNYFRLSPDGKIYVWGASMVSYEGQPFTGFLARLNADGTLDNTFSFLGASSQSAPIGVLVQEDLKVVVHYLSKTRINGDTVSRYCIRLNPDGTTDPTFTAGLMDLAYYGMAIQPDGKFLVAGGSNIGTNGQSQIWRLNQDGSVDDSFITDFSLGSAVHNSNGGRLFPTPDGKILASTNGVTPLTHDREDFTNSLFRMNDNGSFDRSFQPPVITTSNGSKGTGYCLKPMNDGSFLFGGSFVKCNGESKAALVKLNYNGFNR